MIYAQNFLPVACLKDNLVVSMVSTTILWLALVTFFPGVAFAFANTFTFHVHFLGTVNGDD
jgi:hypothetical protein